MNQAQDKGFAPRLNRAYSFTAGGASDVANSPSARMNLYQGRAEAEDMEHETCLACARRAHPSSLDPPAGERMCSVIFE